MFHQCDPYLLSCHTAHFILMFWGPFLKAVALLYLFVFTPSPASIKHLWHTPAPGQPQPSQLSSHLHHDQIFSFLFLWTCHPLILGILFCKHHSLTDSFLNQWICSLHKNGLFLSRLKYLFGLQFMRRCQRVMPDCNRALPAKAQSFLLVLS